MNNKMTVLMSENKSGMKKMFCVVCLLSMACFANVLNAQNSLDDSDVFNHISENTSTAGLQRRDGFIRSSNEGYASEEFRRGVQAYYKGAFNEALIQFEKALSYMPNDSLIIEWLGKAYYKTGLEGTAISYWQTARENGFGGLLLDNKIEIVKERRVTGESSEMTTRLSESGSYPGDFAGNLIYSGPTSVLPNNDGSLWIVAYNSNELLLLNQNGKVIERNNGPINGFDRPVDIIRLRDGRLILSESAGDRIALLDEKGRFEKYIGAKGRNVGQMVGPQYLAQDTSERIYVTDYGNSRVDVFDRDGKGLFYFGKASANFSGLKGPTGIAIFDERIFVADDTTGSIYEFDRAGNFIRELVEENTFSRPEALKKWNNNLIVCDKNKIVSIDIDTGALFEYANTGNAPSRTTAACGDINGNVIVSDFTANEVYVLSKVQELVGGLFIQIEQIDASKFPNITAEIKVENRHRQPIVGLQEENFYVSEKKQPVSSLHFIGGASNNTESDITLLLDISTNSMEYKSEMENAVREIAKSMDNRGTLRVVSAGSIPVTEYSGVPSGAENFTIEALKNKTSKTSAVDLALRLASNDLINAAKKRSIIMISNGNVTAASFKQYNLVELTAFMNNNAIGFSYIQLSQNAISNELQYILNNTSGNDYYVYRPEGLSNVVRDIINLPQGVYQISFVSNLKTNFGEDFLPIEVEVYLLNRSGRDESGYFAPLQ